MESAKLTEDGKDWVGLTKCPDQLAHLEETPRVPPKVSFPSHVFNRRYMTLQALICYGSRKDYWERTTTVVTNDRHK